MKDFEKRMTEEFPNVKKYDKCLFEDYMHHLLIMEQVSKKIEIPLDELIDFFYKGKIKKDLIQREEECYGRQSNNTMREM